MTHQRLHPASESFVFTMNLRGGVFGREGCGEPRIVFAQHHRTDAARGRGDEQPAQG